MDARVLKLYGTLETAPSAKVQWLQIFMAPKIGGCHLVSRVHELYGSKSSGCKITSIGVEFVPKLKNEKGTDVFFWKLNYSKSLFGAVMFCRETLRPSLSLMASFVKAGTFIVSNIYCVRLIFNHLSRMMMTMMGGMMADRP